MPLSFRRKSSDLPSDAGEATETEQPTESEPGQRKGHTPSKRELGKVTRARQSVRRAPEPPPANRREAYRRMREKDRAERAERTKGIRTGDERYMLARDRGPEAALVRDIVDSRRTAGTWFFGGALIVLIGSSAVMPVPVRVASNLFWVFIAAIAVVDSVFISMKIKKMTKERFPKTERRLGSLYFYGIVRGITFRRMRTPRPRIKLGEKF